RRLHAVSAVLQDRAVTGRDAHPSGGVQEQVGRRLAVGDLGGAEHAPREPLVEASQLELEAKPLGWAARRDAHGGIDRGERLADAVNRLELGLEGPAQPLVTALLPTVRRRVPELLLGS